MESFPSSRNALSRPLGLRDEGPRRHRIHPRGQWQVTAAARGRSFLNDEGNRPALAEFSST
jgi:hypothetical protein